MNPIKEISYRYRWLFGWIPKRMERKEMDLDLAEFVHWHATLRNNVNIQMAMASEILKLKTERKWLQGIGL